MSDPINDLDRGDLSNLLAEIFDIGTLPNALREADVIIDAGFGRADRLKWREHSIILNRIGWRLAEVLGDAKPGDESVEGDPQEQLERLIALRSLTDY